MVLNDMNFLEWLKISVKKIGNVKLTENKAPSRLQKVSTCARRLSD